VCASDETEREKERKRGRVGWRDEVMHAWMGTR
jgi:hypothetical protein